MKKSLEKKEPVSGPRSLAMNIFFALLIFAAAFAVRVIYIKQLSGTYFFAPFKGGFDDYVFDNWAREMLKGNWLGDASIFIYRMPLYTYFLWFVYYLFGTNYWAVYITQAAIGAFTCVLVYAIAAILTNNRAASLIAGLLSSLYCASIYFNGMLVGETVSTFIICVAFVFLLLFQQKKKLYHLFLSGIFIGLSMLARGNMLIVFPSILIWILVMFKKESIGKIVSFMLILSAGTVTAISPILARNYIYTKDIVPIVASGGINVYIGNAYGADGKFRLIKGVGTNLEEMIRNSVRIAEEKSGTRLKPSQVSNFWVNETVKSIREHGPTFLLPLFVKKLVLCWNSYETPDIWDYYFFKQYVPILRLPLVAFSIIISFGFVGIFLSWQRRREFYLLYAFVFGYMFSLIVIFITSRYRAPIVPLLSIFSSYGLVRMTGIFRKKLPQRATIATLFIIAFSLSYLPVEKISSETSHNSLGILLKRDGKIEDAIKEYNKAISIAPNYPSPYYNLGLLYRDIGDTENAVRYLEKAIELDPHFTKARETLEDMRGRR